MGLLVIIGIIYFVKKEFNRMNEEDEISSEDILPLRQRDGVHYSFRESLRTSDLEESKPLKRVHSVQMITLEVNDPLLERCHRNTPNKERNHKKSIK